MSHPYAVKVILDTYADLKPEAVSQRLRYSSFVSLAKRYMYFQVPQAACTRMKELLRTVENALRIDTNAVASRLTLRRTEPEASLRMVDIPWARRESTDAAS